MENFNIAELIGRIRDKREMSDGAIAHLVATLSDGRMNDAQAGAFAMAVLCCGLDDQAAVSLTRSMRDSGETLTWNVDGPIVDKHSTGGVGDCVSLALAPILASAGYFVPMISGRGLGHTGGTLDKLEAINGFRTDLPLDQIRKQLSAIGVVMAGQSATLAPADKRLYAVRDVTGTVPSHELICASILSKKLAAGLDRLVLDVKVGTGAFMGDITKAKALAKRLIHTANQLGVKTTAKLTAMDIPLASNAGNALEVREILALLQGQMDTPLYEITKSLCVSLGMSANAVDDAVLSGRAMEVFEKMSFAQGGAGQAKEIEKLLANAPYVHHFKAKDDGEFYGFDAYTLGMTVVELGGGRKSQEDQIDPSVGVSNIARPSKIARGETLAIIHAKDQDAALRAEAQLIKGIRDCASILPIEIEDMK